MRFADVAAARATAPRVLREALALAIAGVLLAGPAAAARANPDLDPKHRGWNGCSELFRILEDAFPEVSVASGTLALDTLGTDDAIFLLHPTEALPKAALEHFLMRGGRLVVAVDRGAPAELLAEFSIEIDERDPRAASHLRGASSLPVAPAAESHRLTAGVPFLLANHPLTVRHRALPALFSFGPSDGLVLAGSVGLGRLVVVGDASIFINNMMALPPHARFAKNLAEHLHGSARLVVVPPGVMLLGRDDTAGAIGGSDRFRRLHDALHKVARASLGRHVLEHVLASLILLLAATAAWRLRRRPREGPEPDGAIVAHYGGLWGHYRHERQRGASRIYSLRLWKQEFEFEVLRRLSLEGPVSLQGVLAALAKRGLSQPDLTAARALLRTLHQLAGDEAPRATTFRFSSFQRYVSEGERLLSLLPAEPPGHEPH